MREKAELIVIGHTKVGENSIVLHTISREYGRRGFLVKVSPKTAKALFLPLNILEAEVTENPKSDLWFARNFVSVNPLVECSYSSCWNSNLSSVSPFLLACPNFASLQWRCITIELIL